MLGEEAAGGDVVNGDEIEIAALRERLEVAVEQHQRHAGLFKSFNYAAAGFPGLVLVAGQFERGEKHAGDAVLNELLAQFDGLLPSHVLVLSRMGRVSPENGVIMSASEACQLSADAPKNLDPAQLDD